MLSKNQVVFFLYKNASGVQPTARWRLVQNRAAWAGDNKPSEGYRNNKKRVGT